MDPLGGLVAGIGLLLLSGVIHAVRRAVAGGAVPPNSAIGIRTRATQTSESAWRAGHQAADPWLLAMAMCGYGAALLSLALALVLRLMSRDSPLPLIVAVLGFVVVITALVIAAAKADAAARAIATSST